MPSGVEAPAQREAQILQRVRSSVPLTVRRCARSGAEKSPFQLVIHPFRMLLATLSVKHPAPPPRKTLDFLKLPEMEMAFPRLPCQAVSSFFKCCSTKPAAYDGILLSFKLQVAEVISVIPVCLCSVHVLYSVKYSCWSNNCYKMTNSPD